MRLRFGSNHFAFVVLDNKGIPARNPQKRAKVAAQRNRHRILTVERLEGRQLLASNSVAGLGTSSLQNFITNPYVPFVGPISPTTPPIHQSAVRNYVNGLVTQAKSLGIMEPRYAVGPSTSTGGYLISHAVAPVALAQPAAANGTAASGQMRVDGGDVPGGGKFRLGWVLALRRQWLR